ncbi:MAG: hypothetical protein JO096_11125, partial [Alphaproteobacteria bacterium]|nr:hypothetical protein [Alphaproteobacteria bacterium]
MTPAPVQPASPRARKQEVLTALLGVVLLAALFLPAHGPVTHSLAIEWRPSAELAGLLFVVAMGALASPRLVAARGVALVLALLVIAAALLNLADVTTPILLGRDLNLYWDLQHFPSLFGLARESAGLWSASAAAALFLLAVVALVGAAYWVWRKVLLTLADRRIAITAAVLFGVALDLTSFLPAEQRPLATGLGTDVARHAGSFARAWRMQAGAGSPLPTALASSGPPRSNLTGLKRRDVYLVYIESYGTTVFDTPEFRSALREALAQFEATLLASGYTIASNRLISPTFGGGSWLAHATLASGIRLDDPVLYSQLLRSGRKLLPAYFKDAGWRAVDIMPGTKTPAPETQAWGFDREIDAAELGYHGPSFGWFAIPDQFTLDRATAIRDALGPEAPVFTQIVLVSSHIPFSPVPPYLADWRDAGAFATVPPTEWDEIFRPPDWSVLASGYIKSLKYDFAVLGDWLAKHLTGNELVILLGDHQPPAAVGGERQQWTVPIHVLSR